MDNLLAIVGEELVIAPEALEIEVLRNIWKRDPGISKKNNYTQKNERVKTKARKELSYIWLMEHWKSPYMVYTVWETRQEKVKAKLELPEDWTEDKAITEAREWYAKELVDTNPFLLTFRAAQKSMVEIGHFLDTIKLTGSDNRAANGSAIFKPKDITSAIKELSVAQESLRTMEEAVKRAQSLNKKVRGGGETGMYED